MVIKPPSPPCPPGVKYNGESEFILPYFGTWRLEVGGPGGFSTEGPSGLPQLFHG